MFFYPFLSITWVVICPKANFGSLTKKQPHYFVMTSLFYQLLGPILVVYCVRLSHAITCLFSKYFQIQYIFVQILKYFALFQHFFFLFLKNRTHALTFCNRSCLLRWVEIASSKQSLITNTEIEIYMNTLLSFY